MNLPDARYFHNKYITAKPYPHIVFQDIWDKKFLLQVAGNFQKIKSQWKKYSNKETVNNKFQLRKNLNKFTTQLIAELSDKKFLDWLQQLTGQRHLLSDKNLNGGGLHAMGTGGFLKIHADFNFGKINIPGQKRKREVLRKINLLLYLNDEWKDIWGGHFEMWGQDLEVCYHSIKPDLGTLVIFDSTDESFHGHPDPLTCPYGTYRKSLALYYYSDTEDITNIKKHFTLYQTTGEKDETK